MAMLKGIYKCEICGNIAEILHEGPGELVCCGRGMRLFAGNSSDGAKEKHVPVIEKTQTGFKVKVGSVPHPMEEKHFIEWIELTADGRALRQFLKPGQPAEANFCLCFEPAAVAVREYCNLHGLWSSVAHSA